MFKRFMVSPKRILGIIIGNILLGIGIGIFKFSHMGNDPFSAMVMALNEFTPLSYAVFLIILNTFIFVFEVLFGRKYIGVGTIVNWFLLGYVVQYTYDILEGSFPALESFLARILTVLIGVILASLGLSLYQTSNGGVAPYDSLALIVHDKFPIPYFWARMFFDATCALIAFLAGGLIGLGTLVCAFGLGPVVAFFNRTVSEKILPIQEVLPAEMTEV